MNSITTTDTVGSQICGESCQHHAKTVTICIRGSACCSSEKPVTPGKPSGADKYDLCEFYYFRHPKLRPGFQHAQGDLIVNAAELFPEAWAYLQSEDGQMLCKTEEEWQTMSTATWATLADGATVGWDGVGGVPFYALDISTGALRLPDLRGMYTEGAGFDSLTVGGVHGDFIRHGIKSIFARDITGGSNNTPVVLGSATGAVTVIQEAVTQVALTANGRRPFVRYDINQPFGNSTKTRAWGSLACVYLGLPESPK